MWGWIVGVEFKGWMIECIVVIECGKMVRIGECVKWYYRLSFMVRVVSVISRMGIVSVVLILK